MNSTTFEQPKPDSKTYQDLIYQIEKGIIKIPKFQREFVWEIDKTAKLLDSILKGYPIGTFILWQTDERLNDIKNVGNLKLPSPPDETKVEYVLDGQQRITSLFAAYRGASMQTKKKVTNYGDIVVNIDANIDENEDQVITETPTKDKSISLKDVLNFDFAKAKELEAKFTNKELELIYSYAMAFRTYKFSTVVLKKEDINSAIEVFTRINTGGKPLTLFEIMSAKTYDEKQGFDMAVKWNSFIKELESKGIKYEDISNTLILNLLSLVLSQTNECKRKTILSLDKQKIIDTWELAIDAIKKSIDYFRTTYRIPVSKILPYDSLLVPFSYFFYCHNDKPSGVQKKLLEEFFWKMALSFRYSSSTESNLAQDIKRIDSIRKEERPSYADIEGALKVNLDSPQSLIDRNFSAGNSFCKAILCLLVYQEPKNFRDNGKVILDNSELKRANSRNYHHFFPKAYLDGKKQSNSNSLVNITFVSDYLNKRKIGAKAPSVYIGDFTDENNEINVALNSHFIDLNGFGIESDDYEVFLKARAERIYKALKARIEMEHSGKAVNEELEELILSGEGERLEFKSTLRYDLRMKGVNKKLEYVIAKTIAAFLNTEGGDLLIGIDDESNALGLENDFQSLSKKNIDGFELQLVEIIKKYIGAHLGQHVKISFPIYDSQQICRVQVSKSGRPVFTSFEGKAEFFVRMGCSSQPLSCEEQSAYEKEHWK